MSVNRRQFIKAGSLALGSPGCPQPAAASLPGRGKGHRVLHARDHHGEPAAHLRKVCAPLQGRIAIKLHTGEPHGPNILPRDMVWALQARIPKSSIVECNVLYPSPRQTTEGHRETLRTNGWTFCPVDIMDADGEVSLPIPGGRHLKEVAVGKNLLNYDSMLVLTHFKGPRDGRFWRFAQEYRHRLRLRQNRQAQLHSDGTNLWAGGPLFMERMVEGGKAITTHFKGIWRPSMSCAACPWTVTARGPAPPNRPPRISASWHPPTCWPWTRLRWTWSTPCPEQQRHDLVERIESRSGLRQLEYMETLGMGHARYDLVSLS